MLEEKEDCDEVGFNEVREVIILDIKKVQGIISTIKQKNSAKLLEKAKKFGKVDVKE